MLVVVLFTALLNSLPSFARTEPSGFSCRSHHETDECFIAFVEYCKDKYVVKQIKDPSPDEQFLLVLDALGCHIAETSNIPMNKVILIPSMMAFPGKKITELPATLHTMAIGVSTDQACCYQDLDLHQRFRKKNSPMWHQWGSLSPQKTGLTLAILQSMTQHRDLPRLVALDTFLGNADRSAPNLFYDPLTDRFCGIDMAASFSSPLAHEACRQLREWGNIALTQEQKLALTHYAHTLELLIQNWPPERQATLLLEQSHAAGFIKGSSLFNQDVAERIEFHKKTMKDNYQDSIVLVSLCWRIIADESF